jgi:hypothetical protein
MATTGNQNREVIKFTSPGLKADVRLRVLDTDLHVHSVILKLYSIFFRKFLDSPDKEGSFPGSAEFKYEWVTKIDEDGSWHLVSAHSQVKLLSLYLTPISTGALTWHTVIAFDALARLNINNANPKVKLT